MKYVYKDEESGELIARDLTPEDIEMIRGFYDLPEDDAQ